MRFSDSLRHLVRAQRLVFRLKALDKICLWQSGLAADSRLKSLGRSYQLTRRPSQAPYGALKLEALLRLVLQ
jgi:hypothetical protein